MAEELTRNKDSFNKLQSDDQKALLDTIDGLGSIGIKEYVNLPQLIVCGDQSCGKSSVLEAISGVKFPAKAGCCTTFATEVILRRAQSRRHSVSIRPGSDRNDKDKRHLAEFKPKLESIDDVPKVIELARERMEQCTRSGGSSFSKDVLCVEINGPEAPHLTIVDLPGLIHSATGKQSPADIAVVHDLVDSYMRNPRSIIVAVVSAGYDHQVQHVLQMAIRSHIDPKRDRTLGIITKPDTLTPGFAAEENCVKLAMNKEHDLRLGWHVLRNRGEKSQELSPDARDKDEQEFFSQGVWATLPPKMLGIKTLRPRLSKVFIEHICSDLPNVVREIRSGIDDCELHLRQLGAARPTTKDQLRYLSAISNKFRDLASEGVRGIYDHKFFESETRTGGNRRIRAAVITLNTTFAETIQQHGRRWPVSPVEHGAFAFNDRKKHPHMDSGLMDFVRKFVLQRNRGGLPGTFDPVLIGKLFQEQASPWKEIASDHIFNVWEVVMEILEDITYQVTEERTAHILLVEHIYPEMNKIRKALKDKLDEILKPHLENTAMTYDSNFLSVMERIRKQRSQNQPGSSTTDATFMFYPSASSQLDYTYQEMVDIMEGYYEIAVKTFVDNVAALVIDNCLMNPLPDLLSSDVVQEWDEDRLELIGGETEETVRDRTRQQQKLEVLNSGLASCQGFISRYPKAWARIDDQKTRLAERERRGSHRQNLAPHGRYSTPPRTSSEQPGREQYSSAPRVSISNPNSQDDRPYSQGSQDTCGTSSSSNVSPAESGHTSLTTPPREASPARPGVSARRKQGRYSGYGPLPQGSGQVTARTIPAGTAVLPNAADDDEL